jgi:hypothetical protein
MEKSQVLSPAAIPRVMQVVAAFIIKMRRAWFGLGAGFHTISLPSTSMLAMVVQGGLFFGKERL